MLPDKMTGKDLVKQETHEAGLEKQFFDSMDKVERRDRQGHIVSDTSNTSYVNNYDKIKWD
jgi:hypothetical protein